MKIVAPRQLKVKLMLFSALCIIWRRLPSAAVLSQ